MNVWRTKTVEQSIADTEEPGHQLRRRLGPLDLTVFGVGVIIGTGIFVLTGKAAGVQAGPAGAPSVRFPGLPRAPGAPGCPGVARAGPVGRAAGTLSYPRPRGPVPPGLA